MKRRTFLQRVGSILAALGVAEAEWLTLGDRYYQALAAPSRRKLALLIGINQYSQTPALTGCVTDVELQRELLIHRFGFQPSDILSLTEEKATRENIETAFLEHLVKQVRAGDVVVFHFSGYGSRVNLGNLQETEQNALVPADEKLKSQDKVIVNYLLEETLLLLLRSLATDLVTAVLDTSYYAPQTPLPTGLRFRAHQTPPEAQLVTAELDFQTQLKTNHQTHHGASLQTQYLAASNPVVLSATSEPNQLAREVLLSGFSAGLFTYALTQHLWELTPTTTIQISLSRVASSMRLLGVKQQPALLNGKKNQQRSLLADNLLLDSTTAAVGVVTATEEDGKIGYLWLGGLPPQVLEHYGVNCQLTLVNNVETRIFPSDVETRHGASLQVRSRTGLTAKAQISAVESTTPLQVGQLLQEAVRVLPRNIGLTVALDTGLERIERVDATSGFATIAHVSSVVAGEQPADYVFAKLPEAKSLELATTASMVVSPSRYGLFSLASEIIPNTAGEVGEAVKVAVQRLDTKLKNLLAAKLWRLTDNESSSRLGVKATLEIIQGISPRVVMQRETVRTLGSETANKKLLSTQLEPIPTVAIGSRIQYRMQNMSDRPVYLMLLGLNSSRNAIAFYPWQSTEQPSSSQTKPLFKNVVVAPGHTLTLPQTVAASDWVIPGPAFFCEHQLIFSTAPFTQTLAALEAPKYPTADQRPIGPLLNPVEVAQAVLQDLHNASLTEEKAENIAVSPDFYALDVNNWASLSFFYQVV